MGQMAPWQAQVMQILSAFVECDSDHLDLPKDFPLRGNSPGSPGSPQLLLLKQLATAQNAVVVVQNRSAYLRRISSKVARAGPFGAIKQIVKRHGGRMSVQLCVALLESTYEDERLLLDTCSMLGTWHLKPSLVQFRKQFKKLGIIFDEHYEWMALRGKKPVPESSDSDTQRDGARRPRNVVEVFAEDDGQIRSTLRLLTQALDEDDRRRGSRPEEDLAATTSSSSDGLPWWGDAPSERPPPSRASSRRAQVAKRRLPAFEMREIVTEALDQHAVVVVVGATGCGKSTQLPIAWHEWCKARDPEAPCKVICCQPRRIAAVSLAERVALENGQAVGGLVGYKIRFETKASRETDMLYCTTGVLLRAMMRNPTLEGVSCVFLDEIHERDTLADFTITVLRDVVQSSRPDLKIVLMSATVDPTWCMSYFEDCHTVDLPGDTPHSIDWLWLEDCLALTKHTSKPPEMPKAMEPDDPQVLRALATLKPEHHDKFSSVESVICAGPEWIDYDLVVKLVEHLDATEDPTFLGELDSEDGARPGKGAVLIFMPGMGEIRRTIQALQASRYSLNWLLLPLHSTLSQKDQQKVFETTPGKYRKIVVTTNIAETSITIDDVVYVIDSGRERRLGLNPETNVSSLMTQWISRSNAGQRRGRAGRCRSGSYLALFSSAQYSELFVETHPPEMQRTQVETLCLQVKALGLEDIEETLDRAPDPPDKRTVEAAKRTLVTLGALKEDGELTRLGRLLMALPVHPQVGKLLLYSRLLGCTDAALTVAASADVGRVFSQGSSDRRRQELGGGLRSDHWATVQAFRRWSRLYESPEEQAQLADRLSLNQKAFDQMQKLREDLLRNLEDLEGSRSLASGAANVRRQPDDAVDELSVVSAALASSLHLARLTPLFDMVCLSAPPVRATVALRSVNASRNLLHPGLFEEAMVVWFNRLQTSDLFVDDTTILRPIHVLLLGPPVSVQVDFPEYAQVQPPEAGEDAAELLQRERERRRLAAQRAQRRKAREQRRVARIRELVEQLYNEHNPAKLPEVEQMFQKYAGVEEDMYLRICNKYDLEPDYSAHLLSESEDGGAMDLDEELEAAARQARSAECHVPWLRCSSPGRLQALLEMRKAAIELFDRFVGTHPASLPKAVADAFTALRALLVHFGALGDLRMGHHKEYGLLEEAEQIGAPAEEPRSGALAARRAMAPVAKAKGKANVAKAQTATRRAVDEMESWQLDTEVMMVSWLERLLLPLLGKPISLQRANGLLTEHLSQWEGMCDDLTGLAITPEFVQKYHGVLRLVDGNSVALAREREKRRKANGQWRPDAAKPSAPVPKSTPRAKAKLPMKAPQPSAAPGLKPPPGFWGGSAGGALPRPSTAAGLATARGRLPPPSEAEAWREARPKFAAGQPSESVIETRAKAAAPGRPAPPSGPPPASRYQPRNAPPAWEKFRPPAQPWQQERARDNDYGDGWSGYATEEEVVDVDGGYDEAAGHDDEGQYGMEVGHDDYGFQEEGAADDEATAADGEAVYEEEEVQYEEDETEFAGAAGAEAGADAGKAWGVDPWSLLGGAA